MVSTLDCPFDSTGAGIAFATEAVVKELDNRALRELSGKAELPTWENAQHCYNDSGQSQCKERFYARGTSICIFSPAYLKEQSS